MTPEGRIKMNIMRRVLDPLKPKLWYYCAQDRFTSGIMDIVGVYLGRFFGMEVKTRSGRTTELQQWTIRQVMKAGGVARVVRSSDDARRLIKEIEDEPRHSTRT